MDKLIMPQAFIQISVFDDIYIFGQTQVDACCCITVLATPSSGNYIPGTDAMYVKTE